MNKEDAWIKAMQQDYPYIQFLYGYDSLRDEEGNEFITLVARGEIKEGEEIGNYYSNEFISEKEFYKEFHNRAKNCSVIKIREFPRTESAQTFFCSVWSQSNNVELKEKRVYYTSGRFVFLKETVNDN